MLMPHQVEPPTIALSALDPHEVAEAEIIALAVAPRPDTSGSTPEAPLIGPGAEQLLDRLDDAGVDLFAWLEHAGCAGAAGQVAEVPAVALGDLTALGHPGLTRLLLVGVGAETSTDLRRAGAALARRTRDCGSVVTTLAAGCDDALLGALVEGLVLGSFVFHMKSGKAPHTPVAQVVLAAVPDAEDRGAALTRACAVAGAAWLSRTLALVPSNIKNPAWLAAQAERVAESSGLEIEVYDEHALAAQGFGGIVGVGQGSATPPRLVRLAYDPPGATRSTPHVVLVGKGITFDTGGLSIKSSDGMSTMKRDMTGGGVVLATMGALAEVGCPVRVTGLIAAAENAVGESSIRPGDVLRHHGGRTSEVTNTDAEGRLVMADALAYAAAELEPTVLVDVATLTGAVKLALGLRTGGLFATDDALAGHLLDAGAAGGEPLWRMPLIEDYEPLLDSEVADADNAPGGAGAITAALFLRHFTGGLPWAHLDVASVGDSPVDVGEWSLGATGFGSRVLLHWLGSAEPVAGVRGRDGGRDAGRFGWLRALAR
ncbi:leucyl aminopeptidase family protein [Nocardioidaceae bacterium]|nr:leucyl aminopeptidase family protein [Nocardioidaceae bacterium]